MISKFNLIKSNLAVGTICSIFISVFVFHVYVIHIIYLQLFRNNCKRFDFFSLKIVNSMLQVFNFIILATFITCYYGWLSSNFSLDHAGGNLSLTHAMFNFL